MIGSNRIFTCIASHPISLSVATGDNTGQILLWNDVHKKHPIRSVYHWHTFPLHTLAFSTEGSYLLSGGKEGVLIKWDLKNEDRLFLPRFECPIEKIVISKDNLYIAVCLQNNGIKIMGFQFDFPKYLTISGLLFDKEERINANHTRVIDDMWLEKIKGNFEQSETNINKIEYFASVINGCNNTALWETGLVMNTRNAKILVTNGSTGFVQFYDPIQDQLIYKLDICHQNKSTGTRYESPSNTQVTKIAFFSTPPASFTLGEPKHFMVTFQYRLGVEDTMPESYLKFWEFKKDRNSYITNTSILNPHSQFQVDSMKFSPACSNAFLQNSDFTKLRTDCGTDLNPVRPTLYTISRKEENFKIWSINYEKIPGQSELKYHWACIYKGSYSYQFAPTGAFDFNPISNMVAIAFKDTSKKVSNFSHSLVNNTDTEDIITKNGKNVIAIYKVFTDNDISESIENHEFREFYDDVLRLVDDSLVVHTLHEWEYIRYMSFGQSHYNSHSLLISATCQRLFVWDINETSLIWTLDLAILKVDFTDNPTLNDGSGINYGNCEKLTTKICNERIITSLSCNFGKGELAVFIHTYNHGSSALMFNDLLNPQFMQILNLSPCSKNITPDIINCSFIISSIYLPVTDNFHQRKLFFMNSEQHLLSMDAYVQSTSPDHKEFDLLNETRASDDFEETNDIDDLNLLNATTPFGSFFYENLKLRNQMSETDGEIDKIKGIDFDEDADRRTYSAKERLKIMNGMIENCPAHVFPELNSFSLNYMESFLSPFSNHANHSDQYKFAPKDFEMQEKNYYSVPVNISVENYDDFTPSRTNFEDLLIEKLAYVTYKLNVPETNIKKKSKKKLKTTASTIGGNYIETQGLKELLNELFL
ncbi:uncharacterized protein LOC135927564 isoform X2 [Gordionus sp. m RMFG-2023]